MDPKPRIALVLSIGLENRGGERVRKCFGENVNS